MVRPGKPQTAHFCGSFSLKNYSMGKKQGPKPRSNLTVLRTVTKPLLTVPYFPLNLNLKKKKKGQRNGHYRLCTGFSFRLGHFV